MRSVHGGLVRPGPGFPHSDSCSCGGPPSIANQVQNLIEYMKRNSRYIGVVEARQTAMFLCRNLLDASLSSVGMYFGGRDHTTVMHAIKTIEQKKTEKTKINQTIKQITSDFTSELL